MRGYFSRLKKEENGAVAVIAAVGLVAFLSIASLVTDLGLRYYQKSELQNALDSAALAAVTYLPDSGEARRVALEYVEKNGFDTANVAVEFPEEGVVRVSDSFESKTLLASVFGENNMDISAHAAAKYIDKTMSIDFDYLMYYDEDSTFHLNGDFREVAGQIFANGDIVVETNDAAVIYGISSARSVTYANNMAYKPETRSHAPHQTMPDWDDMIMSVAPVGEKSFFDAPAPNLKASGSYSRRYSDTYVSPKYISGNTIFTGSTLSTAYSQSGVLAVSGNLYVTGDFFPQCQVWVSGNLYVGGDFNNSWGMQTYVGGSMYVEGSTKLQGPTNISGGIYSGGDMTIVNGQSVYTFGGIRTRGRLTTEPAWGADITVNGGTYVYGSLFLGGGRNTLNGDVKVWGNNYDGDALYMNGRLNLKGDVWCHQGPVAFGGNGDCVIQGIVYAGGTIETRMGGDMSLNGCMIAEGDILVGGASHTYNDSGATLSLYSRKGNVILGSQGTELKMWGIVYAPHGDIQVSTDGLRIFGSLVANTITCKIGCGFYIGQNDRTLPFAKTMKKAALIE